MRAVIGYEEKDPAVAALVHSGYPRFVTHPFVRELGTQIARHKDFSGRDVALVSSARMAAEAAARAGGGAGDGDVRPFVRGDVHGVSFPRGSAVEQRVRTFLQNVGGILSSREAEDALVAAGVTARAAGEDLFEGDAAGEIRRVLRQAYGPAPVPDACITLTPSGMNAVYAAFRAVSAIQAPRGRTLWVQLGWLYLDTIAILKTLTPDASRHYACVADVTDMPALERLFAERGSEIAALVTEVPTNPLMQTADVRAVTALARRHGAMVVLDPTMASPFNVDVLGHADVVVNSLTKFAAAGGDVMAGAVIVNPAGAEAAALRDGIAREAEPVYRRDLARLAAQIGGYEDLVARINASTPAVAAFLASHPNVGEVYWSQRDATRDNYQALARTPASVGAVVSFTVRGPVERFYDRVGIPKGPSFGMANSLLCPYLYLAHYDLVRTEAGRAELRARGLDPALIRLSVGLEPPDAIIAALRQALDAV